MKIKLMSIMLILVIILVACSAGVDESGNKSPKETDNKTVVRQLLKRFLLKLKNIVLMKP